MVKLYDLHACQTSVHIVFAINAEQGADHQVMRCIMMECACSGESGAEKTTGTKRNRRVRRSKSSAAVNDPGMSFTA